MLTATRALIYQAAQPGPPGDPTIAEAARRIVSAISSPGFEVGVAGPTKQTTQQLLMAKLETESGLDEHQKAEILTYVQALEDMRSARVRLAVQIVVSLSILGLCIFVLKGELGQAEVRKEWLALASGLIGTVLGYWLR